MSEHRDAWPCAQCGAWTPEPIEMEEGAGRWPGEVRCALCYPWSCEDDKVLRAKARERARQAEEVDGEVTPTVGELQADPAASTWLRRALASALDRDPVDAANDAELLARVLQARADAILGTDAGEPVRRLL